MRQTMTSTVARLRATWAGFTAGQKTVTILVTAGLLVGALLLTRWAGTPSYSPLFNNLQPTDASAIVDKLSADGVPYQLADGGTTILVPQEQVYDLRLKMSGQGLPAGGTDGYALLDKQGLTTSEFQQQVGYQRALEGELRKTIESIDGVQAASVHLAIPARDVFTREQDKPTASVLVTTRPGATVASGQVAAIVNLVASSVAGMAPADVTVADSTGRVLSAAGQPAGLAAGDQRAQQTADFEARTAAALQAMVDQVVGTGHAVVKVTADLDYDETRTTTERYVADRTTPPLADSTTTESYQGPGTPAGVGGVLGPDNAGVTAGGTGSSTYTKESTTRNNAVGKVVEVRQSAPGAIRRLNVGVLLDTRTAGTVDPAQLQALIASAIGIDPTRGDAIQVTRMAFDDSAAKAAARQAKAAADAERQGELMSLARTGGLVALVVAVLVLAWLSTRKRRTGLTPNEQVQLEALQRELEARARPRQLEDGPSTPVLESAPAPDPTVLRAAVARDEVGELLERQPEEVAQLLRSWLADRRS